MSYFSEFVEGRKKRRGKRTSRRYRCQSGTKDYGSSQSFPFDSLHSFHLHPFRRPIRIHPSRIHLRRCKDEVEVDSFGNSGEVAEKGLD